GHVCPRSDECFDPALRRQSAEKEKVLAGPVASLDWPREVRLHADPRRRKAALDVLVAKELADGDESRNPFERRDHTMKPERTRKRCTRRYRVAIAAMPNSGPGEVPEAALTRETVAKERRGETEQSVVVKRQHNRPLRGGCADD